MSTYPTEPQVPFTLHRGSESQATLVNASANASFKFSPYLVVSFSRDDMRNSKVLAPSDDVLYSISTDLTNAYTYVYREVVPPIAKEELQPVKIAEIKRKDLREDRIKLEGCSSSVKLSDWLHGVNNKWTDFPVSFEWNGRTYTWKANTERQIALYDSASSSEIARFQSSCRGQHGGNPTSRALLALQKEGLDILDAVIVSLLVVEDRLRWREMKYQNADGRITVPH